MFFTHRDLKVQYRAYQIYFYSVQVFAFVFVTIVYPLPSVKSNMQALKTLYLES